VAGRAVTTNRLLTKFLSVCRRFAGARDGNTVITFALAVIPLMGLTGAAVDYTRAQQLQTAMQVAADTTALMVAQNAASQTAANVQSSTNNYYKALFVNAAAQNLTVTGTYSGTNGSTVLVKATATYKTSFMGILGFANLPLAAASTASFGNTRLRVALVLDNTGSMADAGKITALKNALNTSTTGLIDQLKSAATNNGDVYVSIIPFVKDVNLGASNYSATWIDWTDWDASNGTCNSGGWSWWGGGWGGWGSGTQSTCSGTWTHDNHNTWNGCVTDRGNSNAPSSGNYDTNVVVPTTSITATLFAAEQYDSCPQAVMGLSYNWTAMKSLVTNMSPAGNTNQGIGLALGWMSLTGGGPFTVPAEDSNYTYQHVIILLTDGLNTQNRWYSNASQIDARQALTCANAKAAGVIIYAIQVNTDGEATSTLLQNCASDSSKFFLLTSANQIVTTFAQIGTNLSKLHIAK
jgi:Flp pilus assembly protein TadG